MWRQLPLDREERLGTRAAVPFLERWASSTAAFRGGVTGVLGVLREGGGCKPPPQGPRREKKEWRLNGSRAHPVSGHDHRRRCVAPVTSHTCGRSARWTGGESGVKSWGLAVDGEADGGGRRARRGGRQERSGPLGVGRVLDRRGHAGLLRRSSRFSENAGLTSSRRRAFAFAAALLSAGLACELPQNTTGEIDPTVLAQAVVRAQNATMGPWPYPEPPAKAIDKPTARSSSRPTSSSSGLCSTTVTSSWAAGPRIPIPVPTRSAAPAPAARSRFLACGPRERT